MRGTMRLVMAFFLALVWSFSALAQEYIITDLGSLALSANGINSNGQVVGGMNANGNEHAYLYSAGTLRDLGTFGGFASTSGAAISDSGWVVGGTSEPSTFEGISHPFLYAFGTMR